MELTAEQVHPHLDKFTPIWSESGMESNPVPSDTKVTVYVNHPDDGDGFVMNTTEYEMGITMLIAESWIPQTEIEKLVANYDGDKLR